MNRKIISLCFAAMLFAGCNDELVPDAGTPVSGETGEPITVQLSFGLSPYGSLTGTTARGAEVMPPVKASSDVMDVEISAVPDTAASAATRAVPEGVDTYVEGYHVLQFDGTQPDSHLKKRVYYPCPGGKLTTADVTLFKQPAKQRIVVITNVPSDYFDELVLNTSTYSDLQDMNFERSPAKSENMFPLFTNGTKDLIVMSGQSDLTLQEGSVIQASVVLLRTVSKLDFDIQVTGADVKGKFNVWDVSLASLPGRSYVNIMGGRLAVFPDLSGAGSKAYYALPLKTVLNTDIIPALSAFVPVNLQPDVPGTTFYNRRTNAPLGSSYLQIVGQNRDNQGVVKDMVMYHINLGLNFAENYSLPGNYHLKYTIRLKGISDEDSHVIKFIPGYFGGQFKAYNATGGEVELSSSSAVTFRYEKRVEVTASDAAAPAATADAGSTSMRWYTNSATVPSINVGSLTDGFANTSAVAGYVSPAYFPAAYTAFRGLNGNITSDIYTAADWYLPSIAQLMGTWLSAAAYVPTMSPVYWSSTVDAGRQNAYTISIRGEVKLEPVQSSHHYVRGMRTLNK
ncbi:hypothetical protein [Coprobacter tertius]|uniref:DUF4906 domain-containing protein n=1 Tax=Coprobacter tertius TaxID=2944915 RepID=A0ABT1MFH7_9BACT|nr:hypothetical protein [Coprobacter tertius]MCP9611385.1 hypothetical protein [Coprobacter tertius]